MKKHQLVTPSDIVPIQSGLNVIGAFNPGAIVVDNRLLLLVRVAVTAEDQRDGQFARLRFVDGRMLFDWMPTDDFITDDKRVMRRRDDGRIFLSSLSYLQMIWIENYLEPPDQWKLTQGNTILPESLYEVFGIEDPRCTWIDGCFYVTYTSVSSHGACTSLMTTTDFKTFKRHGVVFPCENKDVVLFPDRIAGKIHSLHRPVSATAFCPPEIWTASSEDGICWGHHHVLASGSAEFESDRIGAGTPPVRHNGRYLAIYHASEKSRSSTRVGTYVGAVIEMIICHGRVQLQRRSHKPLMVPTEAWELNGFVPNVVFPTGVVVLKDQWLVFYGAGDTSVGVASITLHEITQSLS
jgi:beta-1,2-mannobiose phosphorylase / 1,2-beta-oligomannan phosphorylase